MNCCSHLFEIGSVSPRTPNGCEECLKLGDRWLHLRLCVTCGHVGCCDDSKNKHAAKHFHSTNHPLIKSLNRMKSGAGVMLMNYFWSHFQDR